MSDLLTKEQANLIVQKLMADIPYNINIMNEEGEIIASGNPNRIGQKHRGAKRAMQQKQMIEVFKDTSLEKRGTNEPIIFNDELIGVVGISGDPDEVRPFTKLVKSIALLLVEELNEFSKKERKKQQKNDFLRELIFSKGEYTEELITDALQVYGINLKQINRCVLVEKAEILGKLTISREIFEWHGVFVAFINEEQVIPPLDQLLIISTGKKDLSRSLQDAENTLLLAKFLRLPQENILYTEENYFANLFDFPFPLDVELQKKVEDIYEEYYETIICFANNSSNIKSAATQLHIHRNTLHYRIQRIYELTNKDPRIWSDLWVLMYHFAYFFKMNFYEKRKKS